jgi:hypothetical protein
MRICLIVIGLGVLIAMELGTPSRSKPSEIDPFEQLTFDASTSGDTLKKGDRLEVHRVPQEVPVQPIALAEPMSPPRDPIAMLAEANSGVVGSTANAKRDAVKKPSLGRKMRLPPSHRPSSPIPAKPKRRRNRRRWSSSSPAVQMRSTNCCRP